MARHNRSSAVPSDGGEDRPRPVPVFTASKKKASLAHEINNPLDSLLNIFYLLETETHVSDEVRRYLALAREEVQRISQIVHGAMQEFNDTEGAENVNVPNLLDSVLDFYKSRFKNRGISITTRYCRDGDLAVYESPLRQAFSNLLLNASDAMPKGGKLQARVSLAHEWAGRRRHGIRVTVADNGCGISANDMSRIWRPFVTTKGAAGNGIGLPFVKDAVRKHGGVLRVRSSTTLGHSGSVFTIFLPS